MIEKKDVRGITDSILARGQGLDPDVENSVQKFIAEVNGVANEGTK